MTEESKQAPAAYLPFRTFLSTIESLEHGLPRKLDRTIWRSQSGIVQGQIMMALRFLDLIDLNDEPTKMLQLMVEKPADRPRQIAGLIQHAYRDVLAHDLTKMTPKMLDEAMGRYNVQGDTRRKAVAFFLRAAKYAELPMHPLLSRLTRNTSNGFRKKRRAKDDLPEENPAPTPLPSGDVSHVSKSVTLPSGTRITLNIAARWLDMSADERTLVFGLVDQLQKLPASPQVEDESGEDEGEED